MVTEQQIKERIAQLEYEKAELRRRYLLTDDIDDQQHLANENMIKSLLSHTLNWVLNG